MFSASMRPPLTPIMRLILWDYDRTSVPYLVLCVVLLAIILFAPPLWLGDPMAGLP